MTTNLSLDNNSYEITYNSEQNRLVFKHDAESIKHRQFLAEVINDSSEIKKNKRMDR
jgi:hypothetical protein